MDLSNEKPSSSVPYRYNYSVTEWDSEGSKYPKVVVNIGPQHPATHGTLRLICELDGEVVVSVDPEIGYLHTGFEKLGESHSWNQFITVTDRMNYVSPLNNNIGFAIAVEDLMGIEVPPRAQYIRVIMSELSRIADHLFCIGFLGLDLGAFSVFLWTFIEREKLYDVFESVTGTRLTTSYTRIGGLVMDLPDGFSGRVEALCKTVESVLKELGVVLEKNRIFQERCVGIGILSKESAQSWGASGPVLRASGVDYDVRRADPYSRYSEFDFEVPTLNDGDCWARYCVRVEEIHQSISIVKQALSKLPPTGSIHVDDNKQRLPNKMDTYRDMESLIHHFKNVMPGHGIQVPVGEYYSATEAPNGELGFHLVSSGEFSPWRVRVRPPSLMNYQCFSEMIVGESLQNFPPILGTLNVIAGELDR